MARGAQGRGGTQGRGATKGRGGTQAARAPVRAHLGEQLRVDGEAAVHGVAWLGAQPLRKLSLHLVRRGGGGGARRGRVADWAGEEV